MYKIKYRYKNSFGVVTSYGVVTDKGLERWAVNKVLQGGKFSNAIVLSDGSVRAKRGSHIDTLIDKQELTVRHPKVMSIKGRQNVGTYSGEHYISVCKKIRLCACSDNIKIDLTAHKSNEGRNVHLFSLIEACGISVRDFIRGYLSVLQPCFLEDYWATEQDKTQTWICDIGYMTSILIKIHNMDGDSPIVISFHESNSKGRSRKRHTELQGTRCAVIVDGVKEVINKGYHINFTLQKGFLRYNLEADTLYYNKGVALIPYELMSDHLDSAMRLRLQQMAVSYYGEDSNADIYYNTTVPTRFDDLSFLSYGFSTTNNICMLLDLFSKTTDVRSRVAIIDLSCKLLMESSLIKRQEIISALKVKYPLNNKVVQALIGAGGDDND